MKKTLTFLLFLCAIAVHAQIPGDEWEYLTSDDRETTFVREKEHPEYLPDAPAAKILAGPEESSDVVAPEDKMMPAARCDEQLYLYEEPRIPETAWIPRSLKSNPD